MKFGKAFIKLSRTIGVHRPVGADADGDRNVKVRVWDLPLRLFHWSMVAAVAIAGFTGFAGRSWWLEAHVIAGYALGVLLAFRFAWGILGSYYSTFRSFPLAPRSSLNHLRSLLRNNTQDHAGHNPVGAWMIIVLLFALSALVASGLVVLGGQENLGPLAFLADFQTGRRAADFHAMAAWGAVGLIAIHLLGVFVEVQLLRHPVLSAMITGNKSLKATKEKGDGQSYSARGLAIFAVAAVILLGGGKLLAILPSSGWKSVQVPAAYSAECGSCHHAFHPSLRPEKSWQSVMSDLSDHFGEDASLDADTTATIESFLTANPAESFDTEAAWRIGRIYTRFLRITDTALWKKRHEGIGDDTFKLRSVGSKVNCNACHRDAASGRFADQDIHLPNGDQK